MGVASAALRTINKKSTIPGLRWAKQSHQQTNLSKPANSNSLFETSQITMHLAPFFLALAGTTLPHVLAQCTVLPANSDLNLYRKRDCAGAVVNLTVPTDTQCMPLPLGDAGCDANQEECSYDYCSAVAKEGLVCYLFTSSDCTGDMFGPITSTGAPSISDAGSGCAFLAGVSCGNPDVRPCQRSWFDIPRYQ